jgi:two-component system NtrC family response regulator
MWKAKKERGRFSPCIFPEGKAVGYKILLIDDEPTLRESLQIALSACGYAVQTARTGEEGLEVFGRESPDLVLLDHWLPGINGDQVLQRVKEADPEIPVIIMTAQGTVDLAVQSMKMGAFDFLVKPFELDQIEALVQKGLERTRLKKELEWLRAQYQEKFRSGGIIGASPKMREVVQLAERLAPGSETTVLIEGETGTGKELLAEYIHSLSPRASFPFVPINCGAFPQELLESELFGYEKGAFTGASEKGKMGKIESAEKGTLFLDEVGELPLPSQVKVLRVLEEKEYFKLGSVEKRRADVRFVAATNKDLEAEVKKGKFRDDLFFRLNVVRIRIPPLRERKEDLLALFQFFMARFNEQFQKGFLQLSGEAEERIFAYPWPGNVRELRNTVERIVLLERGDTILEKHLAFLGGRDEGRPKPSLQPIIPPQGVVLDEVVKEYILEALRMKKGNQVQTARLLGISRSALLYRMNKYGIE